MRLLSAAALALFVAACGDNGGNPDAHVHVDSPNHDAKEFLDAPNIDIDGPPDAFVFHDAPDIDAHVFHDASIDAPFVDGIAGALATADGTGLTLAIDHVTVTYVKPQIGSLTNDPAGFTVQAQMIGPALFVSVDPATLVPPPVVGDVVSFTVTTMGTVAGQRRAQAVTAFARISQGADVAALAQDVTAATDVVSNVADYDSEIVNLTGTMADAFVASGQGFQRTTITSTGITGDANYQLRVPAVLVDALDMVATCGFTVHRVPVGRFTSTGGVTAAEIGAYVAGDITLTACPAPTVASAISLSQTSVRITFTRNVAAGSVMVNGSQFTFDHGLTAMAAVASGRTVTVTTTPQTGATTYTATVAASVTDLQGTALGMPNSATFSGFLVPAVVRINEVNANIAGGCDLIELRVISGGSMSGYKIQERQGGSGELAFTFPTFNVATNDFIVIHESSGSTTCNPNTATTETTSKIDQPAAMFAGNFDTAYDFWVTDTGLTATDNVFTLYDATGTIIDALFASNDPAAVATAASTETQAAIVGVANQWSPMMTTYIDAVFRMNAADDLDGTGTTAAGTSIQRIDNNDTNAKTDWTTGAGAASTWGALNAGQTAF